MKEWPQSTLIDMVYYRMGYDLSAAGAPRSYAPDGNWPALRRARRCWLQGWFDHFNSLLEKETETWRL